MGAATRATGAKAATLTTEIKNIYYMNDNIYYLIYDPADDDNPKVRLITSLT